MLNNNKYIKLIIFTTALLFSACDENGPKTSASDHHSLAKLYLKQGSLKSSFIEAKNALKLDPNNVEILTTLAKISLKLHDGNNASKAIKKALSISPNSPYLQLLLVESYLAQKKHLSAQNEFNKIKSEETINSSLYQTVKANLLLTKNKNKKAKTWYLKAYQTDNNNIKAILGLSKTSLYLNQMSDVERFAALALRTSPNDIETLLWQAQVYILQKKLDEAESILSRAVIELDKYDTITAEKYATFEMLTSVLIAQGKIQESLIYSNFLTQSQVGKLKASYNDALQLISQDMQIEQAEAAFQDILSQAPDHKPSGIILGLINFEKGDYAAANELLTKYSSDESSPLRSKKFLAFAKVKIGKIDEAIKLISETIKAYNDDADLYALLGLAYQIKKDASNSIKSLNKAIAISPDTSIYYVNISKSYLLNKDTKNAILSANKALSLNPTSEKAKLALVNAYFSSKNFLKARNFTNLWLRQTPKSVTALNVLAELSQQNKQHIKAKSLFRKALKIEPDNLVANLHLSRYDLSEKNKEKAFNRIRLIIKKQPDNVQAISLLMRLASDKRMIKRSISLLQATLVKHPLSINTRLALAQLYLTTKNINESLRVIADITEIDNKNYQAYYLKAKAYTALNKIEDAKKTYLILTSLKPEHAISYIELGKLYLFEKNYNTAINYAKKALIANPNSLETQIILANAYTYLNRKALAFQAINSIKNKAPHSHIADELEANYFINNEEFEAAIRPLEQAWSKKKTIQLANKIMLVYTKMNKNNEALNAWDELALKYRNNLKVQVSYSNAYYQNKNISKALKILEKQLKTHPDNSILLNNLANLYSENNDKRALSTALKALAQAPNNPAIQDTVGWIYVHKHKNYEKGIPLLKQAYKASSDPKIKEHLTEALKASGNTSGIKKE